MDNKYFNIKDTLYDITEKSSEATDLLAEVGFSNLKDENMRKTFGKSISLEDALKLKKINVEDFLKELEVRMQNYEMQLTNEKEVVKAIGVLPCPVKTPLTDAFESYLKVTSFGFKLDYEFKAASMGLDWLKDTLVNESEEKLPDIFISAGFDLFFDKSLFGKYEELFEDLTQLEYYNEDFNNEYITLKDPDKHYSILGVVPAMFMVNKEELNGRKMPTSWEDLLSTEFENSISLPMGDFDLFNSILLNIYKKFGEDGVEKLGKSLRVSMHPSEMVKSHIKKNDKPVVTIMPYFFTKMVKKGGPMVPVWPKEGAIISPIFMLTKKEKKEQLKPIARFFASKEVGEILSHNGKFPSVNPKVNNMLNKEDKFMWLGWDFIKENNMSTLIEKCEAIFNAASKGE